MAEKEMAEKLKDELDVNRKELTTYLGKITDKVKDLSAKKEEAEKEAKTCKAELVSTKTTDSQKDKTIEQLNEDIEGLVKLALDDVKESLKLTKKTLDALFPPAMSAFQSDEAVKTAAEEVRGAAHLRNTRGGEVSPPRRFASYRSSGHRHRESGMDYHSSGPRNMEPRMML
jgi:chromosome segregation ATPase